MVMPSDLESNLALQKLQEFAPDAIESTQFFRSELTISVRAGSLLQVCEFLRDTPALSFKYLSDVTALDHYPDEPRFETVYHLYSTDTNQRLRLKVRLPEEDPRVVSVVPVWPGANAFEREIFDLFGIIFEGHPFLQRMLLPEDWEGHPLRKDYPTEGYR